MFTSYNFSGKYIVSEVCSEWTRTRVCVLICQSMTPHTGCMIVLLNYIKVFLLHPLHILFASNDCLSFFPFPCSYPRSEPHHCWSCSLLPLPRLYSLLNHPAVISKPITHPQFLHIASSTVYLFQCHCYCASACLFTFTAYIIV